MTGSARPGSIVAFWDGNRLAFGIVAREEKKRVTLVLEQAREERVNPSRIAFEVEKGPTPGTTHDERKHAAGRITAMISRVGRAVAEVDVGTLWEIVTETASSGDGEVALALEELGALAMASSTGDDRAALALALLEDGIHFARKAELWAPRAATAVEELKHERERLAVRRREKAELFEALASVVRGGSFTSRATETERRYVAALRELAIREDGAPDASRKSALEALEASGARFDRPHEGAFRLLRRLGRFSTDDENLQVERYALRTEFPEDVLEHARNNAARPFDREGREDLTALEAVSIDGPHTREIDDLVSVESASSEGLRVGVHIADPTAFVDPGDPVDEEALARGLSHYMPDLRIAMLPAPISEGAASLVEQQERPALSFLVQLDAAGDIASFEVVRSRVRSRARLDYDAADGVMVTGEGPHSAMLAGLNRFARLRGEARARRGAVRIFGPEAELHVGQDGNLELERLEGDSPSRLAVTEAMVLAGEVAARLCIAKGVNVIYRRQAPPERTGDLPRGPITDPVAARRLLRSMKRAEVGLEPGRHYSLGLDAYAQVTSPIRRYQDLVTHRQITAHLAGSPPCYTVEQLQRIAATTEQAESDARRAERAADEYWLLRYLEGRVGQEVEARVVEVEPRPVIRLTETLREQPMPSLAGVEPGETVRLRVERVNPRAGVLALRRIGPARQNEGPQPSGRGQT